MKKLISLFLVCALIACVGGCAARSEAPSQAEPASPADAAADADTAEEPQADTQPKAETQPVPDGQENVLTLSDDGITLNGETVGSDPAAAVFVSNDIIYYEDRDTYDSGNAYGEGEAEDRHGADEAAANVVVNITEAGTYRVSGVLSSGQVRVDLGEDSREDPSAVVTLILDGADITCTVAPALLFLNAYECDGESTAETASSEVDTSAAGANVIIADGSVNVVNGSHVAKVYKDSGEEKKLWKQDGAVYSYVSMNVNGETAGDGVLTINAGNEGLDTERHLTINGGNLRIFSLDDGINTNEDGVSVTTINGGSVHILAGLGSEGDGVDSNGWLVINGGTVISMAHPASDAGLDSDMGSFVNGGTVVALGSTMDWPESDSEQVTVNLQFAARQNAGDAIVITDTDGTIVFAYDPSEDDVASGRIREYQGAVISCPAFELGETYRLYLGGTLSGTEDNGVYDAASVMDHAGGTKQAYTGTDVRGMGGFPGMPGGFPGEGPETPDGRQPQDGEPPEGFEPPQGGGGPGGQPPQNGERPDGEPPEMPADFNGEPPEMPGENTGEIVDVGAPSDLFYMQDKVNGFSGIKAA